MFFLLKTPRVLIQFMALCFFLLQSCSSGKQIVYFQELDLMDGSDIDYSQNTIRANDILSIRINSSIPEMAAPYNIQMNQNGGQGNNGGGNMALMNGYIVGLDGFVNLPVLGKFKAMGKTLGGIEDELTLILGKEGHLPNPSVHVRIMNAKITVLGEVRRPGTFILNEPYITLPQALGYAGDLTINGRRKDIRIIRDDDGVREILTVDLTSSKWLNDDRYSIRQNDIIIVNPNSKVIKSAGHLGNVGSFFGAFSFVLSTILLLTR
ncbi:polysaccharide biosynthesis/export family protein [Flagellimonas marinaquae]